MNPATKLDPPPGWHLCARVGCQRPGLYPYRHCWPHWQEFRAYSYTLTELCRGDDLNVRRAG